MYTKRIQKEIKKMDQTMIRIKADTKQALQSLKIARRETYDEVIKRLVIIQTKPKINKELLTTLKQRMGEVKKGKVISTDELFKRLYSKKDGDKI